MNQRVVITGMGVMTSLGQDLETFWGIYSRGNPVLVKLNCLM